MAEGIIDFLEFIQIKHDYGKGLAPVIKPLESLLQLQVKGLAIKEFREPVLHGGRFELRCPSVHFGGVFFRLYDPVLKFADILPRFFGLPDLLLFLQCHQFFDFLYLFNDRALDFIDGTVDVE